jgi:sigma-B regulation protein RsbU (phosphoserine phosphatase)
MKILLAEDDLISARLVTMRLTQWGHEVLRVSNGIDALDALDQADGPEMALLDWMMPRLDGAEVCVAIRSKPRSAPPYLILLTARGTQQDLVKGMEAGADDYIVKPFHPEELKVRIDAGIRTIQLQRDLQQRVAQLEKAFSTIKVLQGLLPICSYCKKIRADHNTWEGIECFIAKHSEAEFSHSICPSCYDKHIQVELESLGPG